MDAQGATLSEDLLIARLAERQHGVVERGQLLRLGIGRGAIEKRLRSGRLFRVYRGVYAVGHPRLTTAGRRMAAVLACGPGAVCSHRTAADQWGIRPSASPALHVLVPTTSDRSRPGIHVHRTRRWLPADADAVDGIPSTSVARTLLDLSRTLDDASLRRTVERALDLRLLDTRALEGRASSRLAAALAAADPAPVNSDLERDFLELCRAHGIPRPQVNVRVGDHVVDFLWPEARLVVEVDGWAHHRSHRSFEADRRRDVDLALAGLHVVRFTHDAIAHRAAETAFAVRRLASVSDRASM